MIDHLIIDYTMVLNITNSISKTVFKSSGNFGGLYIFLYEALLSPYPNSKYRFTMSKGMLQMVPERLKEMKQLEEG